MNVLALNSGSSSLKFGFYDVRSAAATPLVSGQAEAIGEASGRFHAKDAHGRTVADDDAFIADQGAVVVRIASLLDALGTPRPAAIGHRVVHGGPRLLSHCRIDEAVLSELQASVPFAPLHMPPALEVIRFARQHFAGVAEVACFDTTFHARMPAVASTLALPRELRSAGIRRYGFHGLSCESIVRQLCDDLPGRLLIAHLGNGASVTAVRDGRSIDTSMGLTPSGGLIMGTRSGDLDPGVLIYLMRQNRMDADALQDLVDHRSGLLGISGVAGDMRRLHSQAATNADARLAIEMFCYAVRKELAAMTAVLGGVDGIVFTGGIGENDAEVRASICAGLEWLGEAALPDRVRVLESQEDEQIAIHTAALQEGVVTQN